MGCGSSSPSLNSTTVPDREPRDDASLKEKDSITKLPAIQENGELKDENSHGPLSSVEKMTSTRMSKPVNKITMLHFNDVYNIEPREKEPVGGAARFVSKVQSYQDENPLIFFSGDCLNPSLMSTVTRGKHMIPVLNKIGVHAALYGNHDFDFGVDELLEFKEETKFPWLLSNVIDNTTGKRLAEGEESLLLEWGGRKIGIIGLVEEEWLVTLATVDPKDITFQGFVEVGRKLAKELREKGAELIVALTHMRVPNDLQLLSSDADIDLILGGHDHHYEVRQENGITFCKSGTDFREMTRLTVNFENGSKKPAIETFKVEITSDIVEEQEMKELADKNLALLEKSMEVELGVMKVELDGRFATVRTQESNLGCDIIISNTATKVEPSNGFLPGFVW